MLALNEKVAAIREYEKRPIYKRIGRMFQCSPDQIKRIVQQKESILSAWEQRTRKCRDAKTLEMKVVRVSMLGKAVYEWIRRMMYYKDILITDGLIQKMALQFKSAMGLQNFFPHQEWCDKFRATYKIYTCDSKSLKISYTQGHSVQIKDVMKDVLSECCPNEGDEENANAARGNLDDDDDGMSDVNSDDDHTKTSPREKLKSKLVAKDISKAVVFPKPGTTLSAAPGMHQLVALPIQGNGLTGMGQKVLVATPIVPPGQKQGSGPMTMTIIPLATLGQHPANNINTASMAAALNTSCYTQTSAAKNDNGNEDNISIPNPMVEIKKEIKEEPNDEEFLTESKHQETAQEGSSIKIKKEYISDEEDEVNTSVIIKQTTPPMPTLLPAHVVAIPIHNKDMLEESSKDSLDDLTLSSLRKRIKTEESLTKDREEDIDKQSSTSVGDDSRNIQPATSERATCPTTTSNMPPMPPLTKAPTMNATSVAVPNATTVSKSLSSLPHTLKIANRKRPSSPEDINDSQELPAIRTCSEARKYLKLLEDFALERENFRLIGLITRADEVLRELDRKETSEAGDNEDDVDVD